MDNDHSPYKAPPGYEADNTLYACPDGHYCDELDCLAENLRRKASNPTAYAKEPIRNDRMYLLALGFLQAEKVAKHFGWMVAGFGFVGEPAKFRDLSAEGMRTVYEKMSEVVFTLDGQACIAMARFIDKQATK